MSATDTINASFSLVTAGDIIAFLALLFTGVAYIKPKLVYKDAYFPICREQLDKVYVPMYSLLLPYMYKDVDEFDVNGIIATLLAISSDNLALVNISLLNRLEIHKNITNKQQIQENYNSICSKVCKNFDECRAYLGLQKRTVYYIINHKQFENKLDKFKHYSKLILWNTLLFVVFVAIPALYIFDKLSTLTYK